MAKCSYADIECRGPSDGEKWWSCPVHGARLTGPLSDLCRSKAKYYHRWKKSTDPLQPEQRTPQAPRGGPGTELEALIARWQKRFPWFNLSPQTGCSCHSTAARMDRLGPDGCEEHIDELVAKLELEAKLRKLTVPFRKDVARSLIEIAIRRARIKDGTHKRPKAPERPALMFAPTTARAKVA